MNQLTLTALHESAHAVAAVAIGFGGRVTIVPDAGRRGHCHHGAETALEALRAGQLTRVVRGDALASLALFYGAGMAAQRRLRGQSWRDAIGAGGEHDARNMLDFARPLMEARPWLDEAPIIAADRFVTEAWRGISRLADALLLRQTIEGHELRAAMGADAPSVAWTRDMLREVWELKEFGKAPAVVKPAPTPAPVVTYARGRMESVDGVRIVWADRMPAQDPARRYSAA